MPVTITCLCGPPEKSRCGSLDPILMRLDQKCQCLTKDVQGADNAFWVKQEIFGIPWNDNFAKFDSQDFKDAKYRIEKAFDEHFLRKDVVDRFFDKGYVRSGDLLNYILLTFYNEGSVLKSVLYKNAQSRCA